MALAWLAGSFATSWSPALCVVDRFATEHQPRPRSVAAEARLCSRLVKRKPLVALVLKDLVHSCCGQ